MIYEMTDTSKVEDLFAGWKNMDSVHLAEKLGYEFDHEYIVYEVPSNEGGQ